MATLFELVEELQLIVEKIIENGGVVDDETNELHENLLDETEDKIAAYSFVVKELKEEKKKLKTLEKHYKKKRKSVEKTIDRMKDSVMWAMKTIDVERLDTEVGKVNIQKASRRSLSIHVDAEDLPEPLTRVSVKPDKKAISGYMHDNGIDHIVNDGVRIAELEPATEYVRFY